MALELQNPCTRIVEPIAEASAHPRFLSMWQLLVDKSCGGLGHFQSIISSSLLSTHFSWEVLPRELRGERERETKTSSRANQKAIATGPSWKTSQPTDLNPVADLPCTSALQEACLKLSHGCLTCLCKWTASTTAHVIYAHDIVPEHFSG